MSKQQDNISTSQHPLQDDVAMLVIAAQKDPRKHFDDLYIATWQMTYGIAFSLVKTAADAEDITQQAYINVYRYLKRLKDPASFRVWLSRIVVNLSNSHLNKRTKLRSRNVLEEAGDGVQNTSVADALRYAVDKDVYSNPELSIERSASQVVVREAVARLPHRLREVIVLRYFADFSLAEIADVLNISVGAVGAYLTRANEKLRELLVEYQDEKDEDNEAILLQQATLAVTLKTLFAMESSVATTQRVWANMGSQFHLNPLSPKVVHRIQSGVQNGLRALRFAPVKVAATVVVSTAIVAGSAVAVNAVVKSFSSGNKAAVQTVAKPGPKLPSNQKAEETEIPAELPVQDNEPEEVAESAYLEPVDYGSNSKPARVKKRVKAPKKPSGLPADTGSVAATDTGKKPLRPAPTVGSIIEWGVWKDQPLKWRVLQVSDGQALLISEYVLSAVPFQTDLSTVSHDYQSSNLRVWIRDFATGLDCSELAAFSNGDFASVLTFEELACFMGSAESRRTLPHPLATGLSIWQEYASYWTRDAYAIHHNGSRRDENVFAAEIGVRPVITLVWK